MDEETKDLTPVEGETLAAFFRNRGNVAATAREVKLDRRKVMRIIESGHVRQRINEEMTEQGISAKSIARAIRDGLESYQYFQPYKREPIKVPDFKVRKQFLELAMKLLKVDLSGIEGIEETDSMNFTDIELVKILEQTT